LPNGRPAQKKKSVDMSVAFSESDEEDKKVKKKVKKNTDDAVKSFDDLFNESVGGGSETFSTKFVFNKDSDDDSEGGQEMRKPADVDELLKGSDDEMKI